MDHVGLKTFNFKLEKDYATPRDLIDAMNYKSRFRTALSLLHEAHIGLALTRGAASVCHNLGKLQVPTCFDE